MKLLKRLRKKESGEDAAAQAARELEAALSAAKPAEMTGSFVAPIPAVTGGADVDPDAPTPDAGLADRRPSRAKRASATVSATGAAKAATPRARAATSASRPAAKKAAPRAAAKKAAPGVATAATKRTRATSTAATKKSTSRTTRTATTRQPVAKKH